MLKTKGYASPEQVKSVFPELGILIKPKAILECYQEIPCNPCSTSCPFGAISIGEDINQKPTIDYNKCTGCGICVFSCPGLAIMVVSLKADRAYFKLPYELLPLPATGDILSAVNRRGEVIGDAKIEHVLKNKTTDKTAVITASVDKKLIYDFVTVRYPE